ncbi:MAG TPA: anti-sigma factor [Ktedonobacterales bacterium]|jgi:anti-sigma-K factor RskA|nr:anti-sigma factor [Ktedonobacterales bacterium]
MDEQHADNLIDAYALGALEADEVAEVESHLEVCPRCQALARAARASAQALLYATPLVEPPLDLRHSVLARVHQIATAESSTDTGIPDGPPNAITAGGLGRWFRTLLRDDPTQRDEASFRLAQLMSDPTCQVWQVGGTADAPGASARLVGTPSGREAVILTSGLHALPPDRAYQVWFLRGGQPIPNAVFHVARGGRGRQVVHAPTRLNDDLTVAVTPEPAAGSPAPTGPIVLMGQLSA